MKRGYNEGWSAQPASCGRAGRPTIGPIGMRERIEAYYAEHPDATQEQVRLATGAPRKAIRKTYDALILAGRLKRAKAMILKDCSRDCSPE